MILELAPCSRSNVAHGTVALTLEIIYTLQPKRDVVA